MKTIARRTVAAFLALAFLSACLSHRDTITRTTIVVEHACAAPAQCEQLAKAYPNDDVILHTPAPAPRTVPPGTITMTTTPTRITEDDPRWNCITMGNRHCGPKYRSLDDLPWAERGPMSDWVKIEHAGYDPYRCLYNLGDTTYIACQDGWTTSS